MKKNNTIGIIIFIIGVLLIIGGIVALNYHSQNVVPLKDEAKELEKDKDTLKVISKVMFESKKNKLSAKDKDYYTIIYDLIFLNKKETIDNITGKELQESALKYFNIKDFKLTEIKCSLPHEDGSSDIIYIYNKATDKYEYNTNHKAHGNNISGEKIDYYMADGKVTKEGNNYLYSARIYYKYDGCDVAVPCGPIQFLDIYPTYDDAVNKTNKIINAIEDTDYCQKKENGSYICDNDEISKELDGKIKTVTFYYEKINNNYIFDKYVIK